MNHLHHPYMSNQKQNTLEDQLLQLISHKIALQSGSVCTKAQRVVGSPKQSHRPTQHRCAITTNRFDNTVQNTHGRMDGRSSPLYRPLLRMLKGVHNSHLMVQWSCLASITVGYWVQMVIVGQCNCWLAVWTA